MSLSAREEWMGLMEAQVLYRGEPFDRAPSLLGPASFEGIPRSPQGGRQAAAADGADRHSGEGVPQHELLAVRRVLRPQLSCVRSLSAGAF